MIRRIVKGVLHSAGFELSRTNDEKHLIDRMLATSIRHHWHCKSQFLQDAFALVAGRDKRNGFFVEFGAGDGVTLSNSCMLEIDFGWTGILAEPNRTFLPKLRSNRPQCAIDARCVWARTGDQISFTETTDMGELSTVTQFAAADSHDRGRAPIEYSVETVSLHDLLTDHEAPQEIDFLSIDTEGSEFTILRALDFNRWRFGAITVEHNFVQSTRSQIHALLTSHGYSRVLAQFSGCDDWYMFEASSRR